MKMTLEITDVNEVRAVLAALGNDGQKPSAPAPAAPPAPAPAPPAPAPAPVAPAPVPLTAPAAPAPAAGPVPTSAPAYTIDQIARAGVSLMDTGKQQELFALLAQYGIQSIQQLRADQYGAFATALRGLGAQI